MRTFCVVTLTVLSTASASAASPPDPCAAPADGDIAWTAPAVDDPHVTRLTTPAVRELGADEMLRGRNGRMARWTHAPELVVLMSVMDYTGGATVAYKATEERLTEGEAADLVTDLTQALALFTAGTFTEFAAVRHEALVEGATASVMRPGQIVVGRYRGLRDRINTIGLGGRVEREGAIRSGSIILDTDYDRLNPRRHLLRAHELGHALGYHHVQSRASIMNPQIGSELTEIDRRAAVLAFRQPLQASAPAACGQP